MSALKPCAHCGSTSIDPEFWMCGDGKHGPGCDDCGVTAESIELWNRRSDPAATAMREALETAAQEMDILAEIGPGDPEMARVRWDVLSKRFRAALALDGDAK